MRYLRPSRLYLAAFLSLGACTCAWSMEPPPPGYLEALAEGEHLIGEGNWRAAKRALEKADRIAGGGAARVKVDLAVCSNRLTRFEEAEHHARAALALTRDRTARAAALNQLAISLTSQVDRRTRSRRSLIRSDTDIRALEEAEAALRTALEITDGEINAVRLNLARVLVRLERDSDALVRLQEIIRSDPQSDESRQAQVMRRRLRGEPQQATLSADGRWLAFVDRGGDWRAGARRLKVADVTHPAERFWPPPEQPADIVGFAFTDDRRIVAVGLDGEIRVWHLASKDGGPAAFNTGEGRVDVVALSADGRRLAVADRRARIVRLVSLAETANEPTVLQGLVPEAELVAFSPDGRWLAAARAYRRRDGTASRRENQISLWNLSRAGAEPHRTLTFAGTVNCIAFSDDGQWLAAGGYRRLRLWDLRRPGSQPRGFRLPEPGHRRALAFSPDGRWLATSPAGGPTRLWDLASASAEPVSLAGPEGSGLALRFSADGRWLASGGLDNTALLFDLAGAAAEPRVLRGHTRPVTTLAFAPGAEWLASGSSDGAGRAWPAAFTGEWPPEGFIHDYDWPWLREDVEPASTPPPPGPLDAWAACPGRAGGKVKPPQRIYCPGNPQYTPAARKARLQGVVIVAGCIDESGRTVAVRVVKSLDPELDREAMDFVARCTYSPATLDGQPVGVTYNMTVNFRIQ